MKAISLALLLLAVCFLPVGSAAIAAPGDAIKSASQRAGRAEAKLTDCGRRFQGTQVIDCVALAMKAYALDVGGCGFIKAVAPRAAPAVSAAANEISAAKTKASALSVLNKTTSILRSLAAESSGEARSVYSRINRALETAISVINSRAL